MLVIISDLHLSDGTTGETVGYGAFDLFRDKLRDLAYGASWRRNGEYRPIDEIHLVLLGDILDVIRSRQWLQVGGVLSRVRPWQNYKDPLFSEKVGAITKSVLEYNKRSFETLKTLSQSVTIPQASSAGRPVSETWRTEEGAVQSVAIHTHYLVGNHDWFFHLAGESYDKIRESIVAALGLETPANVPFPHDPFESSKIQQIYTDHRVFARHGDIYDAFNFDGDRNTSSLGDAIVVELVVRFPMEVESRLGNVLPPACVKSLKEIDNLRPTFVIPVWVDSLLKRTCPDTGLQMEVKRIWDELVDELLKKDFIQKHHSFFHLFDNVEHLEWALKFSKGVSRANISQLFSWIASKIHSDEGSFYPHAAAEDAFKARTARAIVYGHTHVYEMVPLDSIALGSAFIDQVYFNSGTWRPYHQLSRVHPEHEEFIKFQLMTFLAFFKEDERGGRPFEAWTSVMAARA